MFDSLTVRGTAGALLVGGCSTAAVLGGWRIWKQKQPGAPARFTWQLSAQAVRVDRFLVRTVRGLAFTAPRQAGFWLWPVLALTYDDRKGIVTATLGPPQQ